MRNTHFDLTRPKQAFVEGHRGLDRVFVGELNVRETFWMASEFIAENGDSIHRATAVEVVLQLLGSRTIIHIADVNRSGGKI